MNPFAWDYSTWKWFFAFSALWNILGAAGALRDPADNLLKFYGIEIDDYYTLMLNKMIWQVILIFGVAYMIAAFNPDKFVGIIILGIMGKILAAYSFFKVYKEGRATLLPVFAGIGDSIFTLYFIAFLFQ